MPGGGAEILVDRVREIIAPKKTRTDEWLGVMRAAHGLGLSTTATMMYGTVDTWEDRVEHLRRLREVQDETGGFRAFVCWSYQSGGGSRRGDDHVPTTAADYLMMLAVSRLYLDNVPHFQSSWVTQGLRDRADGARVRLRRHGLDHDRGERRARGRHGLPPGHRAHGGGHRGHRAPRRPAGHALPGGPPVLSTRRGAPEAAIVLAAVLYGSTFPVLKQALDDVDAAPLLAWRFLAAAGVVAVAVAIAPPAPALVAAPLGRDGLGRGALAAGYWLQTVGLEHTTASASGLVTSLYLPAVPVIVALLARRAPTPAQALGVALATAGLVLVALRPDLTLGSGDLLTAGAAVAFAAQIVAVERFADVPPLLLTAGQVAVCAASGLVALPAAGAARRAGPASGGPCSTPEPWWRRPRSSCRPGASGARRPWSRASSSASRRWSPSPSAPWSSASG